MPAHPLLELGGEALDPTVQGDVVDLDTTVGQHALEVAVADRELQVPAHRPKDDLGREAEAAKWPGRGHKWCSRIGWRRQRRSYPLTAPCSTQQSPPTSRRYSIRVCSPTAPAASYDSGLSSLVRGRWRLLDWHPAQRAAPADRATGRRPAGLAATAAGPGVRAAAAGSVT